MAFKQVAVELGWGPAKLSGTWEPDQAERDAAWELYVQLVTRISIAPLDEHRGILREALNSLYAIFTETRTILQKYGPAIAREPKHGGEYRFGYLAVWLLNAAVRPFLTTWHPELQRWESTRPADQSVFDHEARWNLSGQCRAELSQLQSTLIKYAEMLAEVCDAPALISATRDIGNSRHN